MKKWVNDVTILWHKNYLKFNNATGAMSDLAYKFLTIYSQSVFKIDKYNLFDGAWKTIIRK